jgi:hypothetical protein
MPPELIQDLLTWGGIILGVYLVMVVTWIFYLMAMSLIPHRDNMHPIAKVHGYILVGIGLILDAFLNIVIATVILLQFPRQFLLTQRLKYNIKRGGWRGKVSAWVCEHLLDQFDPKGRHC